MTYPPADDRLRHLVAQQINPSVTSWKLAFFLADGIVNSPEIRSELDRIADAHAAGKPCGDRQCHRCFEVIAGIRDAARQAAGQIAAAVCACGHPQARHNTACAHCPCVGFAQTWPRQAAGQTAAGMACGICETPIGWVDCPTGGWWAHEQHPDDGHDAHPKPATEVPAACPTPETHNWGCGCPTDQLPGRRRQEAETILHNAMNEGVKDPTIRQKLIDQLTESCRHEAALGQPTVEQPAEAQPAEEAHPPREGWRIELWDGEAWLPSGLVRPDRDLVAQYLAGRRKQRPDATFRLVRETTTWTVEETP